MKALTKNKVLLLDLLIIFMFFFMKIILFNNLIGIKVSNGMFLLIGTVYMIFFIIISGLFKDKLKNTILLVIYSVISLIMLVDTVYYKQFSRLPSLIILKQFSQITTVSESIIYLISFKNILIVLDLIPLIIYFAFIRKKFVQSSTDINAFNNHKKKRYIQLVLIFTFIASSLFASIKSEGSALSQEFFSYHIRDFYKIVFASNKVNELDMDVFEVDSRIPNKDRKFFGIGKDKNVITIQVEALQNFVINNFYEGQEITPNINKLINKDSIYFDNYYQQLGMGNTSDAEFVTNNSLYPSMDGQTYSKYEKNKFYGLPWILKDNNYSTIALHGYEGSFWNRDNAYPYQGFDQFISQEDYDLKETIGLGLSDREFFKQSIEHLKNLQTPYYAFLVTLTSHHPYDMPNKYHKIKLKDEHKDTLLGNYIESINYLDEQLGMFIEDLKSEGLYENTVISIYGDHFAIPLNVEKDTKMMSEYLGYDYNFDEMMNIPLIIHIPDSDIAETNHITGGQIDFLPTILNILGLKNEKGLMFGRDLNNSSEGFVAQQTYMLKGSFMYNDTIFIMSRDGIFNDSEAFDMNTRKPIDSKACRDNYDKAIKAIDMSDYILRKDFFNK